MFIATPFKGKTKTMLSFTRRNSTVIDVPYKLFAIEHLAHTYYRHARLLYAFEPFHENTNSIDSAKRIYPNQPKHAAQANPDRNFSPIVNFLFQESLYLYPPEMEYVGPD